MEDKAVILEAVDLGSLSIDCLNNIAEIISKYTEDSAELIGDIFDRLSDEDKEIFFGCIATEEDDNTEEDTPDAAEAEDADIADEEELDEDLLRLAGLTKADLTEEFDENKCPDCNRPSSDDGDCPSCKHGEEEPFTDDEDED